MLTVAHRAGGLRAAGAVFGRRALRVLAYHRVADPSEPGFDTFVGNVSATEAEFAAQMEHVAERWRPVSLAEVMAAFDGRGNLPPRAVLVTFDDGYRDNLTAALPVLRRFDVPATVFLATDHIATGTAFWWDRVAWCFAHTEFTAGELPGADVVQWSGDDERRRVTADYIQHLKTIPEAEKVDAVDALAEALGVTVAPDAFGDLALDWDEVRSMRDQGVTFGAHTCTHPVLSQVDVETARSEIVGSRDRIAEELGEKPVAFAYPNGQPADFTPDIVSAVADAGFQIAFTLLPGPARRGELAADPLEVRRLYVHHGDGLDRFAAKLAGLSRVVGSLG